MPISEIERPGEVKVCRVALTRFGRPFTAVYRKMLSFRSGFESVLVKANGEVGPWQAKLLRSASKAYAAARRVDRILADAGAPGSTLTHDQYLAYLDRSIRYEAECDRILRTLGMDRSKTGVTHKDNRQREVFPAKTSLAKDP